MATYVTHFTCNYASWPTDPGAQKAAWTKMLGDANSNVKDGTVKFIGWANNSEGCGRKLVTARL